VKKILIVMSTSETLDLKNNKKISTGYFLNELAIPAQHFIKAGFDVVIATPDGRKPVLDDKSNDVKFFDNNEIARKSAVSFVVNHPSMQKPKLIKDISKSSKDYIALFVPGVHAPMNDLIQDPDLGILLKEFHKHKKITAFLCHGVAATLSAITKTKAFKQSMVEGNVTAAKDMTKNWLYADYTMTAFSNEEEKKIEKEINAEFQFYLCDALAAAGAKIQNSENVGPFIVHDQELFTGQNTASALELAIAVTKGIAERKAIMEELSHPHPHP
jgi:putative intracellular protease/amidase